MIQLRSLDSVIAVRGKEYSAYELVSYATVIFSIIFFGFPVYWMVISSVKPVSTITNFPPVFVPQEITFAAWERLLSETRYLVWLRNSLIVTLADVFFAITLSTMAGYALTRYHIPLKKNIARIFIFGYMFPRLLLGVPYFMIFNRLGLLDTLPAVIIAHQAIILPFTTWIMWQFFQTVPMSLEESAWVYGAPRWRGMFEVALPMAIPGIVAVAIFAFAVGWTDFTFALILLSSPDNMVLTLGIQDFMQSQQIYWGNLMAAGVGLALPPLLLVMVLNRYILAGFSVQSE